MLSDEERRLRDDRLMTLAGTTGGLSHQIDPSLYSTYGVKRGLREANGKGG